MVHKVKKVKLETTESHPLEEVLEIEQNTTEVIKEKRIIVDDNTDSNEVQSSTIDDIEYDSKDNEIDNDLQTIINYALDAYDDMNSEMDRIEGRWKARHAEVAVNYLNTALNAVKEKASIKSTKDQLRLKANTANSPRTLNQNLIVADRNELLRQLFSEEQSADEKE